MLWGMTDFLTSSRDGRILHVVLDRPKALNSLNLEMCIAFHEAIDRANADDEVEAVVTTSTSPKAFCAGGDIKQIRTDVLEGEMDDALGFFSREYEMNHALATSRKPVVSVMHGAAMGGGLGISIHGSHRVVTPGVLMAMPETAIGFIPDVGASHFLPRLAGGGARGLAVGLYLGMTGVRMNAADALYTGLATHLIDEEDQEDFVAETAKNGVDAALEQYRQDPKILGTSAIELYIDRIEKIFGAGDAVAIDAAAEREVTDDWGEATLAMMRAHSPSSMVATVELLKAGQEAADVKDCLDLELALDRWILNEPDFVEGVRAVLVDKDRNPQWSPDSVADVDPEPVREALRGALRGA